MTATISTHILSGVDGSHAGGISVTLTRVNDDGSRDVLFSQPTDDGGRLQRDIELAEANPAAKYELEYSTGPYWSARKVPRDGLQLTSEIVLRLAMPDPDRRYHIPIIIAPNSYSVWWSS